MINHKQFHVTTNHIVLTMQWMPSTMTDPTAAKLRMMTTIRAWLSTWSMFFFFYFYYHYINDCLQIDYEWVHDVMMVVPPASSHIHAMVPNSIGRILGWYLLSTSCKFCLLSVMFPNDSFFSLHNQNACCVAVDDIKFQGLTLGCISSWYMHVHSCFR